MNISDQEIIMMLKEPATKEQGFRKMMSLFQEKIYYAIRRIVTSHEDADDVFQNTMIKVMQAINNFRGESGLYTWIYKIATNEALAFRNVQNRLQDQKNAQEKINESSGYYQEYNLSNYDIHEHLISAISVLPERQRLVFQLRYFDELPYAEMSQMLQTTEGNLKAAYHIATQKIISYIKSKEI